MAVDNDRYWRDKGDFRHATEAEKQELLDALAKEGKRWNAEKKCIEDIPKCKFKKGDKVLICDNDGTRETTVLEAYVYDPEVPENDLEVMLKAHMGKQQLSQWQTGWLVLEDEETVTDHTTVIG